MIRYIYAFKNKLSGYSGNVFLENADPEEIKMAYQAQLKVAKDEVLSSLSEEELYYLGTFDTKTLEIVAAKDYVLDLAAYIAEIKASKVNENVI